MNKNKGFTITEVLVALLIFSVVAVPLTGALHHLISDAGIRKRFSAIRLAQNALEEALHFRRELKNGKTEKTSESNGFNVVTTVKGEDLKEVDVRVLKSGKVIFTLFTYVYINP